MKVRISIIENNVEYVIDADNLGEARIKLDDFSRGKVFRPFVATVIIEHNVIKDKRRDANTYEEQL